MVKLTLFRQFYVMVVSYIYFTRIVVYLLKSTTPYQYVWLSDAAGELATLAFYCITGYAGLPIAARLLCCLLSTLLSMFQRLHTTSPGKLYASLVWRRSRRV